MYAFLSQIFDYGNTEIEKLFIFYRRLKLDDPSFNAPIYADLFDDEDGEGYSLIWSRPNRRAE